MDKGANSHKIPQVVIPAKEEYTQHGSDARASPGGQ